MREKNETKLRYSFTRFADNWKLQAGFNTQYSAYENTTIDLNQELRYSTDIDFFKYGFFGNASTSLLNSALDISAGVRFDADTYTQDNLLSTFSPRLAISYRLNERWKLNSTLGRYYKLPPYTILGFSVDDVLVNQHVDYTRSDHLRTWH